MGDKEPLYTFQVHWDLKRSSPNINLIYSVKPIFFSASFYFPTARLGLVRVHESQVYHMNIREIC